VFCPRCGAQNEKKSKYCSACGAAMPGGSVKEPGTERTPLKERLRRLAGTTRPQRLLTIGTAVALVIIVIAVVALPSGDDNAPPQDSYTLAADATCVATKNDIVKARARAVRGGSLSRYGDQLVYITLRWRSKLRNDAPPPDRADLVNSLSQALQTTAIAAGGLSRVANGGNKKQILAGTERVDASAAQVEKAIARLALNKCAALKLGPSS
jgi:hypothetical protein